MGPKQISALSGRGEKDVVKALAVTLGLKIKPAPSRVAFTLSPVLTLECKDGLAGVGSGLI